MFRVGLLFKIWGWRCGQANEKQVTMTETGLEGYRGV